MTDGAHMAADVTLDLQGRGVGRFLDHLRAFESGIDPEKFQWYKANLHVPAVNYFRTLRPGRPLRDWESGELQRVVLTVQEYFQCLGVLEYFDESDPQCLGRMQYRSVNPLGFVGYQVGESILMEAGYYRPSRSDLMIGGVEAPCDRYYHAPLPPSEWRYGIREKRIDLDGGAALISTDANTWDGAFTGKNGVADMECLMNPAIQECVIRDIVQMNFSHLTRQLNAVDISLEQLLAKQWPCSGIDKAPVVCTVSGILSVAHLVGAQGAVRLLTGEEHLTDETGTNALEYMRRFAGYPVTKCDH